MGVVTGTLKNTLGLPFYRPRVAMALAATTSTLAVSASTGVGLPAAFAKVAGTALKGAISGLSEAIPHAFSFAFNNAPAAFSNTASFVGDVYATASGPT